MAGDLGQSEGPELCDYQQAVEKRARMIADVGFWFATAGADRPSDDEIWDAWRAVLVGHGTADSLEVCSYLRSRRAAARKRAKQRGQRLYGKNWLL